MSLQSQLRMLTAPGMQDDITLTHLDYQSDQASSALNKLDLIGEQNASRCHHHVLDVIPHAGHCENAHLKLKAHGGGHRFLHSIHGRESAASYRDLMYYINLWTVVEW